MNSFWSSILVGYLSGHVVLCFHSPIMLHKSPSIIREVLGAWPEEEAQNEGSISSWEMNNSSIIPMIEAVHLRSTNRYAAVLDVARKVRQHTELQQLSQAQPDDTKPLLFQLEAEYEAYKADIKAAEDAAKEKEAESVTIADARSYTDDPGAGG
mmetsp:Transcript_23258/g.30131  ORF Transcript_23258/g.30131 Transcript_23258/m.30131 type:complete len:154 (-) Transcript_23258:83-544(-)